MKYAIWLIPLALIGLAPSAIQDGPSWLDAAVVALLLYGVISAYRLGARWERRWSDLIDEKTASSSRE